MPNLLPAQELEDTKAEAKRCLRCGKPTCVEHCPLEMPIPQIMTLFRDGQFQEAAELVVDTNPAALLCSVMCDTTTLCERHCIRGRRRKTPPVAFSKIERTLALTYIEQALSVPAAGREVPAPAAVLSPAATAAPAPATAASVPAVTVAGAHVLAVAVAIRCALSSYPVRLYTDLDFVPKNVLEPLRVWLAQLEVALLPLNEAPVRLEDVEACEGAHQVRVFDLRDASYEMPGQPALAVKRAKELVDDID
ncbi:MAG: hypothetical protein ACOX4F_04560 [Atopobiaceae bacterium]